MTTQQINEVREIKRLIKVNNAMLKKDPGCNQSASFLRNCEKINNLINGEKYNVAI